MVTKTSQMLLLNKDEGEIKPLTGNLVTIKPTLSKPTDIWRKPGPPKIDTFNAPGLYQTFPLHTFQSVQVTVSARWTHLYDQGGLVFILPAAPDQAEDQRQWIKCGIEFYEGAPYVSTVACDAWADWSLISAGIAPVTFSTDLSGSPGVTLAMERKAVDDTLWVYVIDGAQRIPVREVTWALSGNTEKLCNVGIYAATPTVPEGRDELVVKFQGLKYGFRD